MHILVVTPVQARVDVSGFMIACFTRLTSLPGLDVLSQLYTEGFCMIVLHINACVKMTLSIQPLKFVDHY